MKKFIIICGLLFLIAGCVMYEDEIKTFMTDSAFAEYETKKDHLETSYLEGTVSYADYLKGLRELETEYDRKVKDRNRKLQESQ